MCTGTFSLFAIGAMNDQRHVAAAVSMSSRPIISKVSLPSKLKRLRARAFFELQRQHAHADQIASDECARNFARRRLSRPAKLRAFGGPVARTAGAIFLTGENHQRHASAPVLRAQRRKCDICSPPGCNFVTPPSTAGHHQVFDAHVGEGAARHHAVVAATRTIRVEIFDFDAVVLQIPSGGRTRLDRAGGRNVIGRDANRRKSPSGRAPSMLAIAPGSMPKFSKNGGS